MNEISECLGLIYEGFFFSWNKRKWKGWCWRWCLGWWQSRQWVFQIVPLHGPHACLRSAKVARMLPWLFPVCTDWCLRLWGHNPDSKTNMAIYRDIPTVTMTFVTWDSSGDSETLNCCHNLHWRMKAQVDSSWNQPWAHNSHTLTSGSC